MITDKLMKNSKKFHAKDSVPNFMVIRSQFSNLLKFLFFSLFMYMLIWAIENDDDDDDYYYYYSLTP